MNTYNNFQNYSFENPLNYVKSKNINNDMYNNSIENNTYQNTNNNLYDPYNGLIRGNLFKRLYDPYKIKEPYDIKPMNEQAEFLTYIDALGFAMVDLNLYLDIYPDDKNAINLFNQYRKEKEDLLNRYESKFGPITLNSDSLNSYPWSWDNMPWPWDN